mgnify:CR=1 FL=1
MYVRTYETKLTLRMYARTYVCACALTQYGNAICAHIETMLSECTSNVYRQNHVAIVWRGLTRAAESVSEKA